MNLVNILENIRQGSIWSLSGQKTLDDLNWSLENTTTKPTLEECQKYWNTHGTPYLMTLLRKERDKKLLDTDKYAIPDFGHPTDIVKQEWLTYRQALRNLPTTASPSLDANGDLTNVTWPTPPS
jgi:hypothetical protein